MRYISTRGHGPVSFNETLLAGLAPDGGLFVPADLPYFPSSVLARCGDLSYADLAQVLLSPFVEGEISPTDLHNALEEAYGNFHHKKIAPLKKIDSDLYLLELFHGPTLAFKDFALQLLGPLLKRLKPAGETLNIIGATSGDTGPAAIEGLMDVPGVNIFMLFPEHGTSALQRKQMTTTGRPNVFPIAIDGTFDDAQAIVKKLLGDKTFRAQVPCTAINSISWPRLLPQMVYYFYAFCQLPENVQAKEPLFCVPTGNFGNIYAGTLARRMGLPIGRFVLATNANDVLTRFVNDGDYSREKVVKTYSPSMDIQLASNFERYLFDLFHHDTDETADAMAHLAATGSLGELSPLLMEQVEQTFASESVTDEGTLAAIAAFYRRTGEILDPHTAVGLQALHKYREYSGDKTPAVVVATAHPAKFPETIEKAIGIAPKAPEALTDLNEKLENLTPLPADHKKVRDFIVLNT